MAHQVFSLQKHQIINSFISKPMPLSEYLIKIEQNADELVQTLNLWKLPFQSIIAQLFLTIEMIDNDDRGDTAMDFSSRLSYIYPLIVEKAAKAEPNNTVKSITEYLGKEEVHDINFLNAYAHLSLLMPQFHRGLFRLSENGSKHIRFDYRDNAAEDAEINDRILALISTPMVISYKGKDEFNSYLQEKVRSGNTKMTGEDFARVDDIKKFYERTTFNIKPLSDAIFESVFGLSYKEFNSFAATVRAFADLFIGLGRAYKGLINYDEPKDTDDHNMGEYMEWTSCCLRNNVLGWYLELSGLNKTQFKNILSFYLNIYSDSTHEGYSSEGYCGDGCFPPFIWMEKNILFSPHATKYLLTPNNLLYSYNKNHPQAFADKVSHDLEPCLINQMTYLFKGLPDTLFRQNVDYGKSEVDLIIYSPTEKCALCFQVKATIAPDSARTVRRVEQRAIEGIGQIEIFRKLAHDDQEQIIRNAFGITDIEITFQHFLTVRSCAGSREIWQHNLNYPILNYSLLGYVIAGKLQSKGHQLATFSQDVLSAQQELRAISSPQISFETLPIIEHKLTFPDISMDQGFITHTYTKILKVFPDFEIVD